MGHCLAKWLDLPHRKHGLDLNLHSPVCAFPHLMHCDTQTLNSLQGHPSLEGSGTPTTRRLSLGWWWGRKCSCRHWLLPIYIVSSRPLDSFFSHGGCVHHLEVVRNLKENNHLTDSRRQAVAELVGFGLFIRSEVWGIPWQLQEFSWVLLQVLEISCTLLPLCAKEETIIELPMKAFPWNGDSMPQLFRNECFSDLPPVSSFSI
jgi:hypothetical protein